MTDIKGVLTTLNHRLPAGVDATRLAQWRLRDGASYPELRGRMATLFTQLNAEILSAWGDLLYVTTMDHFEYQNGGTLDDFKDTTELDRAESSKADTVGHSIDLREKSDGLGGSWKFFRDARDAVIEANLQQKLQKGRQTIEKSILNRMFNNDANAVGAGGTGFDMPFCNASASVTYAPPAYGGNTFATTHDHFLGSNSSASKTVATQLNDLAKLVTEHGHTGNLRAIVSGADIGTYNALGDNWIKPTGGSIGFSDRGGNTTGASFYSNLDYGQRPAVGKYFIGQFLSNSGVITVEATDRLTTGYACVYNSYGINNPNNPIAIRIHPDRGFGFFLREIPSGNEEFPVAQIDVVTEYGVSANAGRTNGASGLLVAGGVWVDATIA